MKWDAHVGGWTRPLGGGREVQLVPQIYNWRLSTGQTGAEGYDYSW
jgi:hypothetical protein